MTAQKKKALELIEKFGDKSIEVVQEIILYVTKGEPDWTGKTIELQELQNEILCEKADNYAKRYHEKELNKSHQDAVSGSVAFVKWIEEKMCRDNWFRYDDKVGKWYVYLKGHLTT